MGTGDRTPFSVYYSVRQHRGLTAINHNRKE
jgi:hypothetical protein